MMFWFWERLRKHDAANVAADIREDSKKRQIEQTQETLADVRAHEANSRDHLIQTMNRSIEEALEDDLSEGLKERQ